MFIFYVIWVLTSGWGIYSLLLNKRDPPYTIAWLFFVIVIPIIGPLMLFFFGPQRLERNAVKRRKGIARITSEVDAVTQPPRPRRIPEHDRHVINLAEKISEYDVTHQNKIEIISDPQAALYRMMESVKNAKTFIHLEYYSVSSDEVTEQLFDALIDAAKRGVEVRILYDSLGSLSLKRFHYRKLAQAGVQISGFLPLSSIVQRLNLNFRNHRKFLIIDGTQAFSGSANIGKNYLGKKTKNQWRDNFVHVEGQACLQLQDVFTKDWSFTTQEDLSDAKYYPTPSQAGDSSVQVLESGPDTTFHNLHQALFLAVNSAKRRVLLTTPYFIPDGAMLTSLSVAALKGVDVCLLLPNKSDSKIVQSASRSFYESMLRSGIKIYEYQPRIMHSKMLIVDDKWTITGSFNMDIRSFRLNFELNLLIYSSAVADQAATLFYDDLKESNQINLKDYLGKSLPRKLFENFCRLLSPVL